MVDNIQLLKSPQTLIIYELEVEGNVTSVDSVIAALSQLTGQDQDDFGIAVSTDGSTARISTYVYDDMIDSYHGVFGNTIALTSALGVEVTSSTLISDDEDVNAAAFAQLSLAALLAALLAMLML